jgi:hypothetical protein
MLGKVPETIGILTYWSNRLRGRYSGLMEYKPAPPISGGIASGNGAGKEAVVSSRDTAPGVSNGASHGPGQVAPGVPANGATEPC